MDAGYTGIKQTTVSAWLSARLEGENCGTLPEEISFVLFFLLSRTREF